MRCTGAGSVTQAISRISPPHSGQSNGRNGAAVGVVRASALCPYQSLVLAAPTTHFVALAQAILYRGAGFGIVWPRFLALIAIGGVFFGLALGRFRKTIGAMAWRVSC